MAKIIKFSAVVALLNVCITMVGASYPNKGSPIDPTKTKVNCDGRIYGPSHFQAVRDEFRKLNGKEIPAKKIPASHYTPGSNNQRHYYFQIDDESPTDFAIFTSDNLDIVDVVMRQQEPTSKLASLFAMKGQKSSDRPCTRSVIPAPESKPAPDEAESSSASPPSNSGGGLGNEYPPYSQLNSGSSIPKAVHPSQSYGNCPPQGCPPPQAFYPSQSYWNCPPQGCPPPQAFYPSQSHWNCPPQGCPPPQTFGDYYGHGGQSQQNHYRHGYEEPQQLHNPYGDGTYSNYHDGEESQMNCAVM